MDSATKPDATSFLEHQEQHRSTARCGEAVSWGTRESIETAVDYLIAFPDPLETSERVIQIPDDPELLIVLLQRMHARVLEQCEGSA